MSLSSVSLCLQCPCGGRDAPYPSSLSIIHQLYPFFLKNSGRNPEMELHWLGLPILNKFLARKMRCCN